MTVDPTSAPPDPVVFIDTETLGLDPDVHPVWEVALILPDGTEREWQIAVTGRELALAHPVALEMTHFHDRYNAHRATDRPEHVARDLARTIPSGAHLAGACVSFDEERLRRLLWAHGYTPPWHYHLCDTEAIAAGYLRLPPPWDSNGLSQALGIEPDRFERHTAMGDARWAKAMYEAVMGARA